MSLSSIVFYIKNEAGDFVPVEPQPLAIGRVADGVTDSAAIDRAEAEYMLVAELQAASLNASEYRAALPLVLDAVRENRALNGS